MSDLRFRLESLLLRTVLDLPVPVQRFLTRKPVIRDGQQLAPELQLMLGLQRLARVPAIETLPLPQARAELVRQSKMVGGHQHIGAIRDLMVDGGGGPIPARLYTPTERLGDDAAPTMLFIHGGGWMYGDLESHDAACRFQAEQSGVQILAIDYRLAPEHRFPAALEDCQMAYRWLVENAASVNADPTRLAVGGDSAGGNLSAAVAVYAAENELPLALQLLIYPGTDFTERAPSRGLFGEGFFLTDQFMDGAEEAYFHPDADKGHPDASVLRRLDYPEKMAPACVVTGGFDPLRDEGEAYARALAENGVVVEAKRYPSMIHGFFNLVGAGHEAPAYNREIAERLRQAMR